MGSPGGGEAAIRGRPAREALPPGGGVGLVEHAVQFLFNFQKTMGPQFKSGLLEGRDLLLFVEEAGIERAQIGDFLAKTIEALRSMWHPFQHTRRADFAADKVEEVGS